MNGAISPQPPVKTVGADLSIIGGSMFDINPKVHIDNVERDFQTFDSGGRVTDHEVVLRGESLLVSVNPFFLTGEETASAISVTLQNITDRKKMEAELLATHHDLLRAKDRIEKLAYTDTLTNLPNRRGFDTVIEREIGNSRRQQSAFALVLADVDCFKQFNDLYGHVAGDECLAHVARVIAGGLRRPTDFCARYGGEEFVILLPQTEPAGAIHLMERLRQDIQRLGVPHSGHSAGVVTASFGIAGARYVPRSMSADTARRLLLEHADAALYQAKESGRNNVTNGGLIPSA